MKDTERDAITNPAAGLLVFVTTDSAIYYFDGSVWTALDSRTRLLVDADGNTAKKSRLLFLFQMYHRFCEPIWHFSITMLFYG